MMLIFQLYQGKQLESHQQTSPLMVSDMADGSDPMNAVLSVGNTHSCSDFPELRLYMTYVKRLPFLTMA